MVTEHYTSRTGRNRLVR